MAEQVVDMPVDNFFGEGQELQPVSDDTLPLNPPPDGTPIADDAPVEEEQPQEEETEDKRWAGKYRSPEDLERGYQEANQTIGRQGQELGDLRERLARIEGRLESTSSSKGAAEPEGEWYEQYDPEDLVKAFQQNPGKFLEYASEISLQKHLNDKIDPRIKQLETSTEATRQAFQSQTLQQQAVNFYEKNNIQNEDPVDIAMNELLQDNLALFEPAFASGDQQKIDTSFQLLYNLAQSQVNETSRSAAIQSDKRRARTSPVSGHSGSVNERKSDPASQVLKDLQEAASNWGSFFS